MKPLEQCSSVDEILQFLRGSKSPNYPISPEKLEPALTRAAALGAESVEQKPLARHNILEFPVQPIPINLPENGPSLAAMKEFAEQAQEWGAWEVRLWIERALEARGGEVCGGSIGLGEADVDVAYNGKSYNIRIKPLKSALDASGGGHE